MATPKDKHTKSVETEVVPHGHPAAGAHKRIDSVMEELQELRGEVKTVGDKVDQVLHALHGKHPMGEGALVDTVRKLKDQNEALTVRLNKIDAERAKSDEDDKKKRETEENAARNFKYTMAASIILAFLSLVISIARGR